MANGVADIDRGWNQFCKVVKGLPKAWVTVGFHSDAEPYQRGQETPINTAQLASVHEWGSSDGHTPMRSFFRPTLDRHKDEYGHLVDRAMWLCVSKKFTAKQALGVIGEKVAGDVKAAIRAMRSPLAASTIAAKLRRAQGTFKSYARKSGLKGDDAVRDAQRRAATYVGEGANPLIDTGTMLNSVTYAVFVEGAEVLHPKRVSG